MRREQGDNQPKSATFSSKNDPGEERIAASPDYAAGPPRITRFSVKTPEVVETALV